ncbi:MAG: hypothetical protein H6641_14300 [Caldilineaceae bacterium]|nr:hypothetical protein [Caldilineaceae bacterium]
MSLNLAGDGMQVLLVTFLLLFPLILIDTGMGVLFLSIAIRGSWPDQFVRILTFLFGAVLLTSSTAILVWGAYAFWTSNMASLAIVNLF